MAESPPRVRWFETEAERATLARLLGDVERDVRDVRLSSTQRGGALVYATLLRLVDAAWLDGDESLATFLANRLLRPGDGLGLAVREVLTHTITEAYGMGRTDVQAARPAVAARP